MTISAPVQAYDEAFDGTGAPRAQYAPILTAVREAGAGRLRDAAAAVAVQPRLRFDPIPFVLTAGEWEAIAAGLEQRARALDALAADAHGERRAVAAGAIPANALDAHLERDLWGAPPPAAWVGVAGFDLARTADGTFAVRADDVLGVDPTALPAVRELTDLRRRVTTPPRDVHGPVLGLLRTLLETDPGRSAILVDDTSAAGELRRLGVAVLGLDEVAAHRGRLIVRRDGRPLDAVWLRTDDQRLRDDGDELTPVGDALLEPLLHDAVRVIGLPGSGVAAGPQVARHIPDVIETLLGEDPRLATVAPPDAAQSLVPAVLDSERIEPRAADLRVIAIRSAGGYEVVPGGIARVQSSGAVKDVWVLDDPSRFGR